ncbi:MAG: FtsX-like permease family protein [Usitatibacter sp.]
MLLALRFLREGRTQSALIVGGVMVGVAVVVFISALVIGLQANTITRTLGAQAHIVSKPIEPVARVQVIESAGTSNIATLQVAPRKVRSIDNWQKIIAAYEDVPGVVAVSPMASGAAIALRGEGRNAVTVFGIDLPRYDRIVDLSNKLVTGKLRLEAGEVLVGTELARDLGAIVGDRITISTGSAGANDGDRFQIVGTLDLGNRDLSRRVVYLPLHVAQSLLGLPGGVTSIDLRVRDVFDAENVARDVSRVTPLKVESWMSSNSQLLSALNAQSASTATIRLFVSIVVMLGIASVLVVAVVQKTREIGILRAMGASRGQMMRVFLLQGLLVGLVGSMLGALLSMLMAFLFSTLVRGDDGNALFPIDVTWPLLLVACITASICGVFAAIAPARRAARLDPALAMRA